MKEQYINNSIHKELGETSKLSKRGQKVEEDYAISRSCYKLIIDEDEYDVAAISRQFCFEIEEYRYVLIDSKLEVVAIRDSVQELYNEFFNEYIVEELSLEEYMKESFKLIEDIGTWYPLRNSDL